MGLLSKLIVTVLGIVLLGAGVASYLKLPFNFDITILWLKINLFTYLYGVMNTPIIYGVSLTMVSLLLGFIFIIIGLFS